jgi:hypothetical protein
VVVVAALTEELVFLAAQAVQASLSSLMLALNEAQAAQSHQSVETPFTHSQLQALTLPNLIF